MGFLLGNTAGDLHAVIKIIKRINPIFLSAKLLSFPNILSQFRIVSNTYKGMITIILDVITNHGAK